MGRLPCYEKKHGLKKGPWTPQEDQKLIDYINRYGYGNWRILPKNAELQRCGKSCRLRWANYLRPDIKRGGFSFEEEETIIQLHSIMGNKWSAIAARLPGRTDNEIKNYWNTHIAKRLVKMGIDPVTHKSRLDHSSILSSSLYNLPHHHHHQHHMNMSRLMMCDDDQSLVNSEILKLATSQQHHHQNQNLIHNQELQSFFPMMIQDSVPSYLVPSNQDDDYLKSNYDLLEPFYSEFASVLTTQPSSSSTPLNSSSTTYINSSNCSTEDEKESYCSDNFV